MLTIFKKEIGVFFGSLIGYLVIGTFLLLTGLFIWVFAETSVLNYNYASLDQLFVIGPMIFLFLVPAITMRTFAEEFQRGTVELLFTKPFGLMEIIIGKFSACKLIVFLAIVPTFIYVYTIYSLAIPVGNIDIGAIVGSYIGLFLCGVGFVSIGMYASSLVENQIVGFLVAAFLCFFFYLGFDYLSSMPFLVGKYDLLIRKIGMNYHYEAVSKGFIQVSDVIYFMMLVLAFLIMTYFSLKAKTK